MSNVFKNTMTPRSIERWLGSVPMFLTFWVIARSAAYGGQMIDGARNLRITLPLPTVLAESWFKYVAPAYFLWMPIMLAFSWMYFAWVAKNRKRMIWFNIFSTTIFMLAVIFLIGGHLLPMIKIEDALMRK